MACRRTGEPRLAKSYGRGSSATIPWSYLVTLSRLDIITLTARNNFLVGSSLDQFHCYFHYESRFSIFLHLPNEYVFPLPAHHFDTRCPDRPTGFLALLCVRGFPFYLFYVSSFVLRLTFCGFSLCFHSLPCIFSFKFSNSLQHFYVIFYIPSFTFSCSNKYFHSHCAFSDLDCAIYSIVKSASFADTNVRY